MPASARLSDHGDPSFSEDQVLRPLFPSRKLFGFLLLWEIFARGLNVIVEFASGPPAATGPRALRPLQINRNKQTNTFRGKGSPEEGYWRGRGRAQLLHGSLTSLQLETGLLPTRPDSRPPAVPQDPPPFTTEKPRL